MDKLVILLVFIVFAQSVLGLYQIKKYYKFVNNIKNKYMGENGYYLGIEKSGKGPFSLVVLCLIDDKDFIKEAYVYKGISIMAKFKELSSLEGIDINSQEFIKIKQTYSREIIKAIDIIIKHRLENKKEF